MHPNSHNLHAEADLYCWKAGTDKPEDQNNHLMDALRYAISKDHKAVYAFKRAKGKYNPYDEDGDRTDWNIPKKRMY